MSVQQHRRVATTSKHKDKTPLCRTMQGGLISYLQSPFALCSSTAGPHLAAAYRTSVPGIS
eukprot:1397546-Rhodomonas_salina.2